MATPDDRACARRRGPASCCTAPSNGFDYSGTTTLTVNNGDTFGFTITGSNGDLNSFLRGTLRVAMNVVKNGSFESAARHRAAASTPSRLS